MDLAESTLTFAGAQQRILLVSLTDPAEPAPSAIFLSLFLCLFKNCLNLGELFKFFILGISVNRVGAVALLLINYVLFLQCFICVGVTNFLHRKFYPANLQYVSLKNLIVLYPLHKKVNLKYS